jgi:DNA polymerase III epsilon subunit family exonuclease
MTEGDEIVLVPDAAWPDPLPPDLDAIADDLATQAADAAATTWITAAGERRRGPDEEALPSPELLRAGVEAELSGAAAAALRHLQRWARRRQRHGEAAAPAWGRRGLDDVCFCVIDLETTGLRPGWGDEILEIGAVRVAGGSLGRELSTLVAPLRPISAAAQAVHGIGPADVVGAPELHAVLPWLLELARGCVLVFHNAPFDLGFLQRAALEHDREPLDAPVLDTVVMARRLLRGRVGLGSVAPRLGLPVEQRHRALPDAVLTARLLLVLLGVLQRAGARWLYELPGLERRPPRARRRVTPRPDLMARRLHQAIARGEALSITYRGAAGVAPYELCVRVLRLQGTQVTACDEPGAPPFVLDTTRIERLRPAP